MGFANRNREIFLFGKISPGGKTAFGGFSLLFRSGIPRGTIPFTGEIRTPGPTRAPRDPARDPARGGGGEDALMLKEAFPGVQLAPGASIYLVDTEEALPALTAEDIATIVALATEPTSSIYSRVSKNLAYKTTQNMVRSTETGKEALKAVMGACNALAGMVNSKVFNAFARFSDYSTYPEKLDGKVVNHPLIMGLSMDRPAFTRLMQAGWRAASSHHGDANMDLTHGEGATDGRLVASMKLLQGCNGYSFVQEFGSRTRMNLCELYFAPKEPIDVEAWAECGSAEMLHALPGLNGERK